ncbi:DUF6397 family protein [Streptomyces sp. NPDC049954]|uniref:DUF6397 family protein n=1 Tax=Streptomyces sp. NPDC049954 TaxID=3155779 RepID=UPI003415EECA
MAENHTENRLSGADPGRPRMPRGTLTPQALPSPPPLTSKAAPPLPPAEAAGRLGLGKREFELAAEIGLFASTPGDAGSVRTVPGEEVARLRAVPGFPASLREQVRTAGTAEAAALLDIAPNRFGRLARCGQLVPVRFYVNRYRAVVWLYRVAELREFAAWRPELLKGPLVGRLGPDPTEDLRPVSWRRRRRECLGRVTRDPWERAALFAAQLGPSAVAALVPDTAECDYLHRLRPEAYRPAVPGSPAEAVLGPVLHARGAEERGLLSACLGDELRVARAVRPAPRPARVPRPAPAADPGTARPADTCPSPLPRPLTPTDTAPVPAAAARPVSLPSALLEEDDGRRDGALRGGRRRERAGARRGAGRLGMWRRLVRRRP